MNDLTAVRSLTTLPVVTLGGDVVAQVKDTVFDASAERIGGFTLTGPALLSGPVPQDLPWPPVHCLGPHAVMVRGPEALFDLPLSVARRDALRGRLLGARGVTETGEAVGVVPDVLVGGGTGGRVAAFRLAAHREPVHGPRHRRHRVYVPRGEALGVSGRTLVIPSHATACVTGDLPDFVARVGARRDRVRGGAP